MKNKITFFLPTRKGSQRVKNKNTRKFASFSGGLLENKLRQLLQIEIIDEIILSTNDEACMRIAEPYVAQSEKLKVIERPNELCLDTTNLKDLIKYVPQITDNEHIIWGHVTTPLVTADIYTEGIKQYFSQMQNGHDSLLSVLPLKNFVLDQYGNLINNTSAAVPWPRTQDLDPLYEINHAMFIASRNIYLQQENRIGKKPFLYIMDKLSSMDVDWEEDFKIASIIYENTIGL